MKTIKELEVFEKDDTETREDIGYKQALEDVKKLIDEMLRSLSDNDMVGNGDEVLEELKARIEG